MTMTAGGTVARATELGAPAVAQMFNPYTMVGKGGALYVLLGLEGVGKTHVCKAAAMELGVPGVSTGNLLKAVKNRDHRLYRHLRSSLSTAQERRLDTLPKAKRAPNDIVHTLLMARVEMEDCRHGVLLEGIREFSQHTWPEAIAEKLNLGIRVVELTAPKPILKARITGRRVCVPCDAAYHIEHNPPHQEGRCNDCGNPLTQREEDTPQALEDRWAETEPDLYNLRRYYNAEGRRVITLVSTDTVPEVVVHQSVIAYVTERTW